VESEKIAMLKSTPHFAANTPKTIDSREPRETGAILLSTALHWAKPFVSIGVL